MRGDALQTFKNFNNPNRENLGEILTVYRRENVKPQSMATAKHKFQRLVFNPANQKVIDFLDELQKLVKDAFGAAAQAIIELFVYAKMLPHLKKLIHQAHLENGSYEQIVWHLERELELNGLEAPDELQINTVTKSFLNVSINRQYLATLDTIPSKINSIKKSTIYCRIWTNHITFQISNTGNE